MTLDKKDIKYILVWTTVGSALMIIGVVFMAIHSRLEIDFPWWMLAGMFIMVVGFTCWLFVYRYHIIKTKQKHEQKMRELELVEKGIIQYEEFAKKYSPEKNTTSTN